jgi:hypothetical protein
MMIEYSVTVKDESSRVTQKENTTEPLTLSIDDPAVKKIIDIALAKFKINSASEAPSIVVKAILEVQ